MHFVVFRCCPGSSKKQPSCQTHCEETCMPPFPQFNVVTSLCLERPSEKTAISVRMPACIGQQHWSKRRGGIRCDVTKCRRMAVFFEEPGVHLFFNFSCFHLFTLCSILVVFPESFWAKGSSNSEGLSNIFTSSLHIFKSSYLHILKSSHLHIPTSSHLLIFTSSHPHIFTSSHLHIRTSSHLIIFTSSHLHSFSSSHPQILTSSHPHIFTSSHLHIFTSSHPHIFTSSHLHIFSSSHLLIFTSSHLHIFTSSHPHMFTSSHLHIHSLLPSCSLALLLSCPLALLPSSFSFFSISLLRRGAVPTRRHETQPFRMKWGSIAKKLQWNCDFEVSATTLSREMRFDRKKTAVKLRLWSVRDNPFARNEVRPPKTVKLRFWSVRRNPFARNEVRSPKLQ